MNQEPDFISSVSQGEKNGCLIIIKMVIEQIAA